jgi:uncharacterized membrane protein
MAAGTSQTSRTIHGGGETLCCIRDGLRPRLPGVTTQLVLPSSDDPVVAGAVEAIGGPPGKHARVGDRRFWTPIRVLLALTLLTSLLGFAQKAGCRDGSTWVHEHQYTRACYTDVVALYSAEGLSSGQKPYYEHPVEYPVVIGGVMSLTARLAGNLTSIFPDTPTKAAEKDLAKTGSPAAQTAKDYAKANARGRHFYDLTWVLVTLCALIVTVTTAKLAGRRPWDAALFALSPALLLHATTNWDLIAMAFAGLGMLAWARRYPAVAGVLLGLATATKLYPVLFLVPLFFLCLRARKLRAWGLAAAMTLAVAVGVTAPVYLTAPSFVDQTKVLSSPLDRISADGLSALKPSQTVYRYQENATAPVTFTTTPKVLNGAVVSAPVTATNAVYRFFELNKTRGADWDSLYLQLQHLHRDKGSLKTFTNPIASFFSDTTVPPKRLNRVVAVLEVLAMAGLGLLILRARRRPRLPQVLFLAVTAFLLLNKVDSPQYVLWLVPLAALARPRWRPFLAWQAAEALVLLARFYFFVHNDKPGEGIGYGPFFAAVLLRDVLLLVFAAFVVRDILRPELDPVRADGVDDPAGGVLDEAPDRVLIPA